MNHSVSSLVFESPDGVPYRVRHLIAKLVWESVRDIQLRQGAVQLLTFEAAAAGLKSGNLGKAREGAQHLDLDQATGHALQSFEDGLYLLFVDEEEGRSLEEMVSLKPDIQITLIRLTALSGR